MAMSQIDLGFEVTYLDFVWSFDGGSESIDLSVHCLNFEIACPNL